jgi:uncharacterized protein (UPF0254 family)
MKRNADQQSIKASIVLVAALAVAALSGCASLGDWNYAEPQDSLADYGGGGGDSGSAS